MDIVVDTTAIVAVITNEPTKELLIEATRGATLRAPLSLHWEVGNALSKMFKRKRITLDEAERALQAYSKIEIELVEISLQDAVSIAYDLRIYAYDAYIIGCALKHNCPLISLDGGQLEACRRAGVQILEVEK